MNQSFRIVEKEKLECKIIVSVYKIYTLCWLIRAIVESSRGKMRRKMNRPAPSQESNPDYLMGQEARQQSRRKLEIFVSGLGGIRVFISPFGRVIRRPRSHSLSLSLSCLPSPLTGGQALGQLDFDLRQEHPFLYATLEIHHVALS